MDEIQTLKAGIMEIGDIYVVNKADLVGAEQLVSDLNLMCDLSTSKNTWEPPIVKTIAVQNEGIAELIDKIHTHREYLNAGGKLHQKRKERTRQQIMYLIEQEISGCIDEMLDNDMAFDELLDKITSRQKDPYSYAKEVTGPFLQYLRDLKNRQA